MLVHCPNCNKQYTLPQDVAQNPTHTNEGLGWILSCFNCNHQWWQNVTLQAPEPQVVTPSLEETPISTPQTFENLTNLSNLQAPAPGPSAPTSSFAPPPPPMSAQSSFPPPPSYQVPIHAPLRTSSVETHPHHGPQQPSTQASSRRVFGISFILISLCLFFLAGFIYFFHNQSKFQILSYIKSAPMLGGGIELPLRIEDVRYDIQTVGERKTILVVGRVINPHNTTTYIKPLGVTIWGSCTGTSGETKNPQGLCLITNWQHRWDKTRIIPGEAVSFETVGSIPATQMPSQVDVTLP